MTPSAPVCCMTSAAFSGESISPFAKTGIDTADLIFLIVSYSASPLKAHSLVRLTGAATQMFEGWGYAPWFATLIGVFEFSGAIGLLIPKLTRYAILGLSGIMIGASYTHIANAEGAQVLRPLIFLALLWTVWWLRD